MKVLVVIFSIIYILGCGVLVTLILLQKKRSRGPGVLGQAQTTYADKNKGRTMEGTLEKYTKIGIALFLALTVVTWFIK